jgi:hypothetical protein
MTAWGKQATFGVVEVCGCKGLMKDLRGISKMEE